MKVTNLMNGDWVNVFDTPKQIEGIRKFQNGDEIVYYDGDNGVFIKNVTPIPITPEILEKNGFNDTSFEANLKFNYVIFTNEYQISYYPKTNSFNICKKGIDPFYTKDKLSRGFQNIVKYVHELQHALKICGIEKKIIL